MGFNLAGVIGASRVIANPSLLVPNLIVRDIRQLDWKQLQKNGINAVIFDKDNCLTIPLQDQISADLKPTWDSLVSQFGRRNVLIVSNSAGTRSDPCLIQAESVSRNFNVPVLIHADKKPACVQSIMSYFNRNDRSAPTNLVVDSSSQQHPSTSSTTTTTTTTTAGQSSTKHKILIVGDRFSTDVILANKLATLPNLEVCSVLTTRLYGPEGLGVGIIRKLEWATYSLIMRYRAWKSPSTALSSSSAEPSTQSKWSDCVLPVDVAYPPVPLTGFKLVAYNSYRWTYHLLKLSTLYLYRFIRWITQRNIELIKKIYENRRAKKLQERHAQLQNNQQEIRN